MRRILSLLAVSDWKVFEAQSQKHYEPGPHILELVWFANSGAKAAYKLALV